MYTIRRHRRRLLFPPGLLALGFLLLLGCWVIGQQAERLKKYNAIQIQPIIKQSTREEVRLITAPTLSDLERQLWHTVTFTGVTWQRYFLVREVQSALLKTPDRSKQNMGLRIRFTKQATYGELIQIVNLIKLSGLQKWWLDMRYEPTTLYIPGARTHARNFIVQDIIDTPHPELSGSIASPTIPFRPTPQEDLSLWARVENRILYHPITATWFPWLQLEWHSSFGAFLAIASISFVQLLRQWRQA